MHITNQTIRIVAPLTIIAVVVLAIAVSMSNWRGFGFRANGPERSRLHETIPLKPGMSVADIGAGNGELTVVLAEEVGPSGRVYSTDIDPTSLERIRVMTESARLTNVTLVRSQAADSKLPENCCDAIIIRRVYHHLTAAPELNATLLRALRPGGVLAVIDFPPLLPVWPLNHGVDARRVMQDAAASGFQLVRVVDDWPGRGPLTSYCALFTKRR
jgi:predicted methyltransferase